MSEIVEREATNPPARAGREPGPPRLFDPWFWLVLIGTGAAAPAAWWIAGGNTAPDFEGPYYMVEPLPLSKTAQTVIGVSSSAIAFGSIALVAWLVGSRRWSARWIGIAGAPFVGSAYGGLTYHWAVLPVSGANIWYGLAQFFAIPLAVALIAVMVACAWPRKTLPPVESDE